MPIINKVSASVFDRPAKPAGRQPSPEQLALIAKIKTIASERDVCEVLLTGQEKPATVRQQIQRAAKDRCRNRREAFAARLLHRTADARRRRGGGRRSNSDVAVMPMRPSPGHSPRQDDEARLFGDTDEVA